MIEVMSVPSVFIMKVVVFITEVGCMVFVPETIGLDLDPVHTSTLAWFGLVWHDKITNVNVNQTEPYRTTSAHLTQLSWHDTVRLLLEQRIKILF